MRKGKREAEAARRRDLDETRRLLYMAKFVSQTKHYELAGTLVNALRHHQGNDDPRLEEHILTLLNAEDASAPRSPLLDTINRL